MRTLGQVAGLSGIGLGVLLLIFRDVIKKIIFAKLTEPHSFILLILILLLVWCLTLLALALGLNRSAKTPRGKIKPPQKPHSTYFSLSIIVRRSLPVTIFAAAVAVSGSVSWFYLVPKPSPLFVGESQKSSLAATWDDLAVRTVRVTWDIHNFSDSVSAGQTFYLVTTSADHGKCWRVSKISDETGSHVFGLNDGQRYVLIVSPRDGPMKDEMPAERVKVIIEAELPE